MADPLASIRGELGQLPEDLRARFDSEYDRKRKSSGMAYLAWFLLGWHYAYLGRWGWQVIYWLVAITCYAAAAATIISPVIVLIWWIVDAFRLPGMVANYNRDRANEVLADVRSAAVARNQQIIADRLAPQP